MGNFFCLSEHIWHREKLYIKGHYRHFLSNIFCLRVPKIFIREPFSVSESIDFREKFCIKGCSHDSDENCLSHSAEGFRGKTLLCIRKRLVSKKFLHNTGISQFSVENILSHNAKRICVEKFCVSEQFSYRKKIYIKRVYSNFCRIFFVSQSQKSSFLNPSVFQKVSRNDNIYA